MALPKQLLPIYIATTTLVSSMLIAATSSASYERGTYLAQKPNCNNPQTQTEMNICAGLSYRGRDRLLNQVYTQLREKLPGTRRELLTEAQLAWIKFRDTNCEFERSAVEGGTMAPMIYSGCRADVTEKRTADLESYLQGQILQPSSRNYRASDRQLNQVYKQLVSNLSVARRNKLKQAELAWIAFRDANCTFEASTAAANERLCLTRMTQQRTKDLQQALDFPR